MRQPSEDRSSQDGDDAPRGNHPYKSVEEPPRNHDGKMICKNTECASLTFNRKYEWRSVYPDSSPMLSNHFTVNIWISTIAPTSALLGAARSCKALRTAVAYYVTSARYTRCTVAAKTLFCSFADCKRSSGSGFVRGENLVDHIRRVHRRTSMSANLGHLVIPRPASREGSTAGVVRPSESPFQCITKAHEDDS